MTDLFPKQDLILLVAFVWSVQKFVLRDKHRLNKFYLIADFFSTIVDIIIIYSVVSFYVKFAV